MKTQTSGWESMETQAIHHWANGCARAGEGHCITCSDEARPARVLQIEPAMALVQVEMTGMEMTNAITEVDSSLLEDVAVGSWLLVHGGVALERLSQNIVQI